MCSVIIPLATLVPEVLLREKVTEFHRLHLQNVHNFSLSSADFQPTTTATSVQEGAGAEYWILSPGTVNYQVDNIELQG